MTAFVEFFNVRVALEQFHQVQPKTEQRFFLCAAVSQVLMHTPTTLHVMLCLLAVVAILIKIHL